MKRLLIIACLFAFLQAGEGHAAARELKQSELRKATTSGSAIRLKRVIKGVERVFGGTPVDARAFQADKVYYRILVKKPDGRIISVIVNAQTGVVVPNRSTVGRQISDAARSTAGNSANANSQAKSNNSQANSGNGNGNSGGNGNGNSGGNGNGNSGGNGNGNSGGNGNGNSGGNGNGNSGGNGNGNSGGNGNGNSGGNGNGNSGGNGGGKK
ncbi:PepSY domain-containing protein [Ruegeria halocynthiae]|uniref:PepSY domain-containing protein n=1 Tax=Ruegeria halocynthiae TaxID=985054 RepID=UPI000AC4B31D|nr:hypothetical protein [Ruegeria halocynthiae]